MSSGTRVLDEAASAMHLLDYRAAELKQVPTRNGFGEGLIEAGTLDRNVLGVCADLSESTRFEGFKKAHPEVEVHVYECGHGFNCDQRGSYNAAAAKLARQRTLAFFGKHLA